MQARDRREDCMARLAQNFEIRKTPAIINAHPAKRVGLAECCAKPIQPK
jgi:hypothetical protein